MGKWHIILLIYCCLIYAFVLSGEYSDYKFNKERGYRNHHTLLEKCAIVFAPISIIIHIFYCGWLLISEYYEEVREHGGYKAYKNWKAAEKAKRKQEEKEYRLQLEEDKRIKKAYLDGDITRVDLPRVLNGVDSFEFEVEMGLYNDYMTPVPDILYIENSYCESLNDFFKRNKNLRLYNMYKFVYLPRLNEDLKDGMILHYLYPGQPKDIEIDDTLTSNYPLKYLWYPEDASRISHGMIFFDGIKDNHGAKYIAGYYYPLEEGSDEYIIEQLHAIVKDIHYRHSEGGTLYTKEKKPKIEEGSTEEYADELFSWIVNNDNIAILVNEIRDRVKVLKEKGVAEKLLLQLLKEKPKLSRLVITKDMRIILPDYNEMEVKMEPINKAVYLLFLQHPEGIVFKHLADYRKELADIYQKIKPFGLNDRVIRSIEDVTNPCLNSINEKCARIRGAFVSQFDESLAQHYYIYGERGKAKKISLSRDLVTWE